jgi:hypothetical protein
VVGEEEEEGRGTVEVNKTDDEAYVDPLFPKSSCLDVGDTYCPGLGHFFCHLDVNGRLEENPFDSGSR